MRDRSLLAGIIAVMILAASSISVASAHPARDQESLEPPFLDMLPHSLPPYSSAWYRFEFVVEHPGFLCRFFPCPDREVYHGNAVIRINDAARSGLAFEVYSPAQIRDWSSVDPVGRGSAENSDLVWAGESGNNETWYIRVVNNEDYEIDYRFAVTGVRIALSRPLLPTATPWSVSQALEKARRATSTPAAVAETPRDNVSPSRAVPVSHATQVIPAGTDRWYVLAFPMGQDNVDLRLVDGAITGLAFDVYMPAQSETWWKDEPLGRGAPLDEDLLWSGGPDGVDRRLIRVINRTSRVVEYILRIELTRQPVAPVPPFGGLP